MTTWKHPTHIFVGCTVLWLGLTWSWLFTMRIAELSGSLLVGYLCVCFSFLMIVGIAVTLYTLYAQYFWNRYTRTKQPTAWFLVQAFFTLAAVGWLVSMLSAVLWIGRDGSLDTVLPFSSLTPLLMYTPVRFLARVVGFHGLSALVVVLVVVWLAPKLRKYAIYTTGLVIALTVLAWVSYRQADGPAVKTVIVAEELEQKVPTIKTDAQVVVFPEYGLDSLRYEDISRRVAANKSIYFVGSQRMPGQRATQNVLTFGNAAEGIFDIRPKSRLIPGGEYLPYGAEGALRLLRQHNTLQQFRLSEAVQKGPYNNQPLLISHDVALGSAVCASIIAPQDYRDFAQNGATIFTNSASLSLFNSSLFLWQHQGMARFMATANARPFAQSSNGAPAFALDHNGMLQAKIQPLRTAEVTLQANKKRTPYTQLGEWPVYVGLVVLIVRFVSYLRGYTASKSRLS